MLKKEYIDLWSYFKYSQFRQENANSDEWNYFLNKTEQTKPIFSEPYQVGQYLKKPSELVKVDFSSFIFNNLNILFILFIGYFCLVLIVHMILKFVDHKFRKWKGFKINSIQFLSLSYDKQRFLSPKISLVRLFYSIFLFIILFLLSATIKTDKVVVDTEDFIDSERKFIEANKTMIYNEKELFLFEKAPKGSFFNNVYVKRFKEKQNNIQIRNLSKLKNNFRAYNYFVFGYLNAVLGSFFTLYKYSEPKSEFIFIKSTIYYENLNTVLMRKNLDLSRKRMINLR